MFPLLAGRGVPQVAGRRSNPVVKIDCHPADCGIATLPPIKLGVARNDKKSGFFSALQKAGQFAGPLEPLN